MFPPVRPCRRRLAFTLIELLVVIAIIAVLASILFPVFSQARAKARETKCLSNMKQIGTAIQMYLQDYDGVYFDDGFYSDPAFGYVNWTIPRSPVSSWNPARPFLLGPYLKNADVLICSQEREIGSGASALRYPQYAANKLPSISGVVPPDGGAYVGPLSEIAGRSTPLLRTDSQVDSSNTLIVWEHNSTTAQCNVWSTSPGHWDTGHQGGFIGLWCDGHVKRMTVGQLQNRYVTYWGD